MFQLESEPQNKQNVLKQALTLYWHTLIIALPYSLCAAILFFAPQLLLGFQPFSIALMAGATFCTLFGIIFTSALIFRLYCYTHHIPNSFFSSMRHALFKLIPLLLLIIIYSLIILGGTMLLIIPGVILSVSLMFSFILVITSNQNVLQTLIASHRLVWGQWWHTALIMSLPLLLNIAISLAIFLFIISFATYYGISLWTIYLLIFSANVLLQTLFIPLIFNVALVLLQDLKQRSRRIQ